MIEAVCIRTCYDSEACVLYERNVIYRIDEARCAKVSKDVNVKQRRMARNRGETVANGLIKYFTTIYGRPADEPEEAKEIVEIPAAEEPREDP